jgi:hypothetical protein
MTVEAISVDEIDLALSIEQVGQSFETPSQPISI